MSLKIECASPQEQSFELTSATAPTAPAPFTPRDRVEHEKGRERAFAGSRNAVEQYLFERFDAVPPSGSLTLELKGKAKLGSGFAGAMKVTADRGPEGDYTVRVSQGASVTVGVQFLAAEANLQGAATWWVRTPEAAADLVTALAQAQLDPTDRPAALARTVAYVPSHLTRTEFTSALDLHASGHRLLAYVGGEVSGESTVALDFHRRQIVVEQGVGGEFVDRVSAGLGRVGSEYELTMKLRTVTTLPPSLFDRVASGELSWIDVVRQSDSTHQLVLEGETQGELVTVNGGVAQVKKLEARLDLHALARHPLQPRQALEGEIEVLTSLEAAGCGVDFAGNSLLLRSATFSVTKQDLFAEDDGLQSQVDVRRLTAPR